MRPDRIQVMALLAVCVAAAWIFDPALRLWEILVVGIATALWVAPTLAAVLIRMGVIESGTAWGDGSWSRAAQGLGVALLVYGSVGALTALVTVGSILLAAGVIIEIRQHWRVKHRV
jgi:hypothetical protein